MAALNWGPGRRFKYLFYFLSLVIGLYEIAQNKDLVRQASWFDRFIIESFAPLQSGLVQVKKTVKDGFDHYLANVGASQENALLNKRLEMQGEQLFKAKELLLENERLKKLLQFEGPKESQKVLAQIVGSGPNGHEKIFRINKGTSQGIKLASVVMTAEGLVGHVLRASSDYSDVLTIQDTRARVDIMIQRNRARGILEGLGSEECLIKYLSLRFPVGLDDVVITSGLGPTFPKGIPVGRISYVQRRNYDMLQDLRLTPFVDFDRLEEVVVLVGKKQKTAMGED